MVVVVLGVTTSGIVATNALAPHSPHPEVPLLEFDSSDSLIILDYNK